MHFNSPRRFMFGELNRSFSLSSAISLSPDWVVCVTPIKTDVLLGLFTRQMGRRHFLRPRGYQSARCSFRRE
jgi:hypothetical protein